MNATLFATCVMTVLINTSKLPWNKHDKEVEMQARNRCVVLYPNSPCLKSWTKTGLNTYRAVCGRSK